MIKAGQKEMAEVNKMPWEEGRYLMSVCHDMVSNKKKGHLFSYRISPYGNGHQVNFLS